MVRMTRRQFVKLSAALLTGAVLGGCRGNPAGRSATTPDTAGASENRTAATTGETATVTGPVDMVLVNGKVITMDARDTIAQAVAVRAGNIVAVGKTDQIRALTGPQTQVIDLKGKTLTPGLIDSHCHMETVGMMADQFTAFVPPEVTSMASLQKKLAGMAASTPKGEWILGAYFGLGNDGMPHRQDLDAAAPAHPVWMMQQGGHYGSANSLALKIAGITASTQNPGGGIIERDAKGEPTGLFYNHRAMDLLRRNIPTDTRGDPRGYIASSEDLFAACGVTSYHDNNVRDPNVIAAYLEPARHGNAQLRNQVYYTLEWPTDLTTALAIEHYQDTYSAFAGFKFLIDGQVPTAYCHQPHNGASWNMPTWDVTMFKRIVRQLHDTGLQISVHCMGDAAVDLAIDAYVEAMHANPRPDPRHRIEHALLTTRDATKRMKDYGIIVNTQPAAIRAGGDNWAQLFGAERSKRICATREWLDNGVHLALSSDAPTTPWYTPQATMVGAMKRLTYSNKVLAPDQCLTIQDALRAHTMGAAYAGREEKVKGSIEPGKVADLAVWNEDPYSAADHLMEVTIATTIVGGKIVYPKPV